MHACLRVLPLPLALCAWAADFDAGPLQEGRLAAAAAAAGFQARHVVLDAPPAVRPRLPFASFGYDHPDLAALRRKFELEKVVAPAKDEWTAQLLLKEWLYQKIPGGNPRVNAVRAMDILDYAARGETFYCSHYAISYAECAQALGWQARRLGVDRRHGPETLGSTHHGVAEVWSNRFRKWVVMDSQSNLHFERGGVPLSAWEIRAAWLADKAAEVKRVVGVPPRAVTKNPAIVWWNRPDEDEIATYFWVYIEDRADGSNGRLILPLDGSNGGRLWYQNDYDAGRSRLHRGYTANLFVPVREITDAYWTVCVPEVRVTAAAKGAIQLALDSYCPDRKGYEMAVDGGKWAAVPDEHAIPWNLRRGWNSLGLRTAGPRGITGPETNIVMYLE